VYKHRAVTAEPWATSIRIVIGDDTELILSEAEAIQLRVDLVREVATRKEAANEVLGRLIAEMILAAMSSVELQACNGFADLHDFTDANDFIQDAWREYMPDEEYDFDLINEALAETERILWS
jgi:hypothetical protein